MNENDKFRKMENRYRMYQVANVSMSVIKTMPCVKDNKSTIGAINVIEQALYISSIVNYFRSIEKYDDLEEGEEYKVLWDFLNKFVIASITNSLKIGWSLSSDEYKKDLLKRLNVPREIIDRIA